MPKHFENSHPPKTIWVTSEDFEFMCFNLAKELFTYNEPIPDYSTRDNSLLESALGSSQQTFNKKLLYPTLSKQASILFYTLIKNHPFKNGNKRVAVITLLIFLRLNKKWINISPDLLYRMACIVSESPSQGMQYILETIEEILEDGIRDV